MSGRVRDLDKTAMTADQRRVHDEIAAGPRGAVPGPFRLWLHAPEIADHAQKLGAHVRYRTRLPPRLKELVILVTARHWRADFEWWAHEQEAVRAGLPPDIIAALAVGKEPEFTDPGERLAYEFATAYFATKRVPPALFEAAVDRFTYAGTVELAALLGYYSMVAATLNIFEYPAPPHKMR